MLTLYDTGPSNFPTHLGCSPHARKIIFALNYKKLPFKLISIPFGSIEITAKSIGAAPTEASPFHTSGPPRYCVPFLHDTNNNKNNVVSDSFAIAEYLDATYPDTPRLFANDHTAGVKELISAREKALRILMFPVFMRKIGPLYSDEQKGVFASRGMNLDTIASISQEEEVGLWAQGKNSFEEVEGSLGDSVNHTVSVYADLALAALAWHIRCGYGEASKEWQELASWADGKMGQVTDAAVKYDSQILSA
ncbi:hypothetical protein PM082_009470 [Marasmius tenuissimus]|nr:hypothetical protein PM082_009470 [Marasmius tenuissimus]